MLINRYYHNQYFYEDFKTILSPDQWNDKSEIESMYLTSSPVRETMNTSLNVDTADAYGNHTYFYCLENHKINGMNRLNQRLMTAKGNCNRKC